MFLHIVTFCRSVSFAEESKRRENICCTRASVEFICCDCEVEKTTKKNKYEMFYQGTVSNTRHISVHNQHITFCWICAPSCRSRSWKALFLGSSWAHLWASRKAWSSRPSLRKAWALLNLAFTSPGSLSRAEKCRHTRINLYPFKITIHAKI